MKRIMITLLFFSFFLCQNPLLVYGVKAYPFPVRVVQPDGSILTIRIHGDEFLNWKTSGGRLVKQGKDRFYYYASFSSNGDKIISTTRAIESTMSQFSFDPLTDKPPQGAYIRAASLRKSIIAQNILYAPSEIISTGEKRFLVILAQFADLSFTPPDPQAHFFDMLNLRGYNSYQGTGSAYDYFYENSSGQFYPQFDVVGPVTLSGTVAYYGENYKDGDDVRPREMVVEAVLLADQLLGIDFSQYDIDRNGYIDNIFVFYAGYNEAEGGGDDTIWPHKWSIYNQLTVDGVKTGTYACTSEFRGEPDDQDYAGIGTFCHEFSHVLGLPDFYDTAIDNEQAEELGNYSLMSYGNYNNNGRTPPYFSVMERMLVGWITAGEVPALRQTGYYELDPVFQNTGFRSPTPSYTENYFPDGEYHLYENRQKTGWDTYLPHAGLLIYHVDRSPEYLSQWSNNEVNIYSDHECFDLIEANDPYYSPFPGSLPVTEFTSLTQPAAVDWDGDPTGYDLRNISTLVQRITFTTGNAEPLPYYGIYLTRETYTAGDAFLLQLSGNGPERVSEQWFFNGVPQPAGTSVILPAGDHTIKVIVFYGDGSSETIFQQLHVE